MGMPIFETCGRDERDNKIINNYLVIKLNPIKNKA